MTKVWGRWEERGAALSHDCGDHKIRAHLPHRQRTWHANLDIGDPPALVNTAVMSVTGLEAPPTLSQRRVTLSPCAGLSYATKVGEVEGNPVLGADDGPDRSNRSAAARGATGAAAGDENCGAGLPRRLPEAIPPIMPRPRPGDEDDDEGSADATPVVVVDGQAPRAETGTGACAGLTGVTAAVLDGMPKRSSPPPRPCTWAKGAAGTAGGAAEPNGSSRSEDDVDADCITGRVVGMTAGAAVDTAGPDP